ncbi:MAG: hypothetical protein IIT46_18305 [Lachnospiraceae bacterium]|nr:hypothetical protein [Lachnospiraceae bacterium]
MNKSVKRVTGVITLCTVLLTGCNSKNETIKTTVAPSPTATIEVVELGEDTYTTLKDGVYTSTGGAVQVTVPKNWTVSKDSPMVLVAGKEEETKDCLSVTYSAKDSKFSVYKQEDFEEYYNQNFDNYKAVSFEKTTVAGLEAWCLTYTFSTDRDDVTGYEYFIDGNYSYVLSFIDVSGKLKDQIPEIIDSVKICK